MSSPVAKHATAVEVETTPVEGVIHLAERFNLLRSTPEIPALQRLRHRFCGWIALNAFGSVHEPKRGRLPCLDLHDVIHDACGEHLLELLRASRCVALVAHLRDHFELLLGPHEDFRFFKSVRQWLFHIHMLAERHRADCGGEMRVIGSHHAHGIDVFAHLVQHLTEVVKAPHIGKSLEVLLHTLGCNEIHIRKGHWRCDASRREPRNDAARTPADPNAAKIDATTRRQLRIVRRTGARQVGGNEVEAESRRDGVLDETTTGSGSGGCRCGHG